MENKLTTITQLPITEIMSIGKAFAESGMFADTKSAAQAIVKIQAGQEIGIPPFAAMTGIHIIQGKPTIGAGLIASRVKGSGKYDYRVIESTELICTIEFFQGKESIGKSSFTVEDAKKAGTKNLDKFPKNMLFARAISNGVKWFTPDVFSGPVYVPEEMMAVVTEDVKHIDVEQQAYDLILSSQTLEELTANWKLIGKEMQSIDRIIDVTKRCKAEIIKLQGVEEQSGVSNS
jgi:hypothetical protein